MNPATPTARSVWHVGLGFLIASFLFAVLVVVVRHAAPPPAIDAARAALRRKDLAEIRATAAQDLNHPGWINQSRGIVRLPIGLAMKIIAAEWRHPAAARSNLIAREKNASAPAPAAPAKPNPFE